MTGGDKPSSERIYGHNGSSGHNNRWAFDSRSLAINQRVISTQNDRYGEKKEEVGERLAFFQ